MIKFLKIFVFGTFLATPVTTEVQLNCVFDVNMFAFVLTPICGIKSKLGMSIITLKSVFTV